MQIRIRKRNKLLDDIIIRSQDLQFLKLIINAKQFDFIHYEKNYNNHSKNYAQDRKRYISYGRSFVDDIHALKDKMTLHYVHAITNADFVPQLIIYFSRAERFRYSFIKKCSIVFLCSYTLFLENNVIQCCFDKRKLGYITSCFRPRMTNNTDL